MKLSKNLTLKEVIKSNTAIRRGINNTPTPKHIENLKKVSLNVFQVVRNHFKTAIGITSGYRGKALNKAVGGSKTSDHCKGMALDLDADIFGEITNEEIFNFIKENLEFKQLIWEYGTDKEPNWVHVSYDPKNNKKQVLKAVRGKGYIKF